AGWYGALRQGWTVLVATFVLSLIFLAGLSTAPVTILAGTIVIVGLVSLSIVAAPAHARRRIPVATNPADPVVAAHVKTSEPTATPESDVDGEPGLRLVRTGTAPHEQVEGTIRF